MIKKAWQYAGYIERINIKGARESGAQFLFAITSPDGKSHWSFTLDSSNEVRYGAMASLLIAAWSAGKIVYLNATPSDGGDSFASEIQA
jgi:hypothetical protein